MDQHCCVGSISGLYDLAGWLGLLATRENGDGDVAKVSEVGIVGRLDEHKTVFLAVKQ
jgi:hypothetical protein